MTQEHLVKLTQSLHLNELGEEQMLYRMFWKQRQGLPVVEALLPISPISLDHPRLSWSSVLTDYTSEYLFEDEAKHFHSALKSIRQKERFCVPISPNECMIHYEHFNAKKETSIVHAHRATPLKQFLIHGQGFCQTIGFKEVMRDNAVPVSFLVLAEDNDSTLEHEFMPFVEFWQLLTAWLPDRHLLKKEVAAVMLVHYWRQPIAACLTHLLQADFETAAEKEVAKLICGILIGYPLQVSLNPENLTRLVPEEPELEEEEEPKEEPEPKEDEEAVTTKGFFTALKSWMKWGSPE